MLRVVVDTNIWVRALLGGRISLPVLQALLDNRFTLLVSDLLVDELREVTKRPRLRRGIDDADLQELLEQIEWRGEFVTVTTIPPRCRDPKDEPVLATAIDGRADAIVTGDDDLRDDERLRQEMLSFGVELWGVQSLLDASADRR